MAVVAVSKIEWISFALASCLGFCLGGMYEAVSGAIDARRKLEAAAALHHAGHYAVDPKTGTAVFVWNDEEKTP